MDVALELGFLVQVYEDPVGADLVGADLAVENGLVVPDLVALVPAALAVQIVPALPG